AAVWSAVFSPDGKRILTASVDKTARVWEAVTGLSLYGLQGANDDITKALFNPLNNGVIVTAGRHSTARLWQDERLLVELRENPGEVADVTFSRDGRLVATA